jgi:hypothetical protein
MVDAKPANELMDPNETPAIVPAQPPSIVVEARIAAIAVKRMGKLHFLPSRPEGGGIGRDTRQAVEALQL